MIVVSAGALLIMSNYYLENIYVFIRNLDENEFVYYVNKILKVYLLIGFIILNIGVGYVFIKAHIFKEKEITNGDKNSSSDF